MNAIHDGFSTTRRLILKGAASVALVGLGNPPFGPAPALAGGGGAGAGRASSARRASTYARELPIVTFQTSANAIAPTTTRRRPWLRAIPA